jgi:tRNA(Ile)-lysidine synthase
MRYQFLSFVAGEKGIDAIATGHTADDQAETVLMRVIRGSGVRGIRGMLPAATVPGGSQRLVRPLLETPRAVTQAICAEAGIEPLKDESNSDTAMLRNRLRHEVIPVLQSVNPSVTDALRRLADNAREVFEGVERRAMSVQPEFRGPQGAVYALQHVRPLESEGLVLVIEREAAFFRLEAERNATRLRNLADVLRAGHGSVEFGRAEVEVSSGRVRIGPRLEYTAVAAKVLNVPGSTLSGPWRVDVSTSEFPGGGPEARGAVPIDGLSGALRVRSPEPGDRMLYGKIVRRVSDILSTARVPAWDRRAAIAIADGRRVLAVLTADGTFETDLEPGADVVHVRVATAPART